jgi:hypothetical protein
MAPPLPYYRNPYRSLNLGVLRAYLPVCAVQDAGARGAARARSGAMILTDSRRASAQTLDRSRNSSVRSIEVWTGRRRPLPVRRVRRHLGAACEV